MIVELKDVCEKEISNIRQKDLLDKKGDYPIYGASGLIGNVDFYRQETPYVAVVKDGAGIGRAMLLPAKSSVIGTMQYLIPKGNVLPEYLYYVVKNMHLEKYYSGATIPHIYFKYYKKEKFNLVDLDQQRKIISVFKKIEDAIRKQRDELTNLDTLIKARFVEMFEREINIVKIEDVCSKIVDCPHSTPKYKGKLEYPCIRTSEIKDGFIDWGTMKYVSREECSIRNKRIIPESGDIVYAREGNYGNAVVLPEGHQFCLGQRTMLFRPDYKKCNSQFLLFSLLSNFVKKQADVNNNSSTVPHVNVKDAKKFKIKLPEIDKQNEFASFVKQVDKSKVVNASIMKYIISIRFYLYFKENKEGAR